MYITNDGPLIASTDYWTTGHARRGLLYVSVNAGAVRVLVPAAARRIDDPAAAAHLAHTAVLSRGPWPSAGLSDALELLLDDGSQQPWSAHLSIAQCDRLPLDSDVGRLITCTLWVLGQSGATECVAELPCYYRRSAKLPDLTPYAPRA